MGTNHQKVGILPTADEFRQSLPLSPVARDTVKRGTQMATNILSGTDPRKLLIIGPCSVDYCDSVMEYAHALRELQEEIRQGVGIIFRCYTGKPRTRTGWRGLQQGLPHEGIDIARGIERVRQLMHMILEIGLPIADEMLHTSLVGHFSDCLSYQAIGARSVEDASHREVASGVDAPVGVKNPTSGDLSVLTNSISAINAPSAYVLPGGIWKTTGNPLAHAILRGWSFEGKTGSNYDEASIRKFLRFAQKVGLHDPRIVIDTNHDNSGKRAEQQIEIMRHVMHTALENPELNKKIGGFMVEGYLQHGNQKENSPQIIHGLSLTDPCISLPETIAFARELNSLVGMTHALDKFRDTIDHIDTAIIRSLAPHPVSVSIGGIAGLLPEEIESLRGIGLHFTSDTWRLLAERFAVVRLIGKEKKRLGINHIVDRARKAALLKDRESQAPKGKKGKVRKLFEIVHDIAVRIQTPIVNGQ